jgi:hypothetical protein
MGMPVLVAIVVGVVVVVKASIGVAVLVASDVAMAVVVRAGLGVVVVVVVDVGAARMVLVARVVVSDLSHRRVPSPPRACSA